MNKLVILVITALSFSTSQAEQRATATQSVVEINSEAVVEQMLRERNVSVWQDGTQIGSLAVVLATELARLVNKDRVVIRNVCQRDGELNIDDCKLTLQYGDIAGGTTPGQSAIFSYTLQRRLSVPVGEDEFSFSPTVVLVTVPR